MAAASNADTAARPVTGRMVLACLVAFFVTIALVNAFMIRVAVTTFGGVEASNSYQAGLAYAREIEASRTQDARHWRVKANVRRSAGETLIEIVADDAAGLALNGLTATASLAHPVDRRSDRELRLVETEAGRFAGSASAIAGQWDLVITLSRNGERLFRSRNRVNVK